MFTIYHSNDITVLKEIVFELIHRDPLPNPFIEETILVQSPGMSQWLRLQFAERFNIAANINFPFPSSFIWDVFTAVVNGVPEHNSFSKEQMTWRLMELIPDYLEHQEFKPLQSYLAGDNSQIKRYQLSAKVADIYDQYLVYRPRWINAWENEELVSELAGADHWQAVLWRALVEATATINGASHYHRANLYDMSIKKLESVECPDSLKRLQRVFVFGISALPPAYLNVLSTLSQHIDIHLMLANPCRYYWGDINDPKYLARMSKVQRRVYKENHSHSPFKAPETDYVSGVAGNSLLASCGKTGRDMQRLLTDFSMPEIEAFVDIDKDTLLHSIQHDILTLNDPYRAELLQNSSHKQAVLSDDKSLRVSVCHSSMREVEALHDYLLGLMDDHFDIQPRDIVVMVADIDAYSPYINAVFSAVAENQFIPFSISDMSSNQYHTVIQAFIWLLGIHEQRFTASELVALIQVPAVMTRLGIDDSELALLTQWISDAGVRWGLDKTTAASFDLPEMETNTWLFGLHRMLAGYAMPDSMGVVSNILPFEQVQGMNAELVGKLGLLLDKLITYRGKWQSSMTPTQWKDQLDALREDFFKSDNEDDARQLIQITDSIGQWADEMDKSGFNQSGEQLTAEVVMEVMSQKLTEERASQRFLAGQVNFCTLMPMRSLPFKVVCLLGMDSNTYPRQQQPPGFDLMQLKFEYGDRSKRDDDRFLFLEAVLAAQSFLYISYTGYSIRDNSITMPSILVSELLDYCAEGYVLQGDEDLSVDESGEKLIATITHGQPMTPYSPIAFQASAKGKPSYARHWFELSQINHDAGKGQNNGFLPEPLHPLPLPETLDLNELKSFWMSPAKYFMTRRLKVYFDEVNDSVSDDENFELDHLESYLLKNKLTQWFLSREHLSNEKATDGLETDIKSEFEQLYPQAVAEGVLPQAAFGKIALSGQLIPARLIADEVKILMSGDCPVVKVDMQLLINGHDMTIEGWVSRQTNHGFINYRVGHLRPKDLFSGWIDHLAAAAMGQGNITHWLGYDKKSAQIEHIKFSTLEQDEAILYLQQLTRDHLRGLSQPLWFALEPADKYFSQLEKGTEAAKSALLKALENYVSSDEYAGCCWPAFSEKEFSESITGSFIDIFDRHYQPMIQHQLSVAEQGDT